MRNKFSAREVVLSVVSVLLVLFVGIALLVGFNKVASPVIEMTAAINEAEVPREVLPSGDAFTKYEEPLIENVKSYYVANNQEGIAVVTKVEGYGGDMTVMTGINSVGQIVGIKVIKHNEAEGIGTRAMTAEHLAQYIGMESIAEKVTQNSGAETITEIFAEEEEEEIDVVAGATITSDAIDLAARTALDQYKFLKGKEK